MILVDIAAFLFGGLIGYALSKLFHHVSVPAIGRAQCTESYCNAFRSQSCSDGRCCWHCRLYCECGRPAKPTPLSPRPRLVGKPNLRVIKSPPEAS